MKRFILIALLLAACKNGDCEFGPVDEYARCAQACGPKRMKSFKQTTGCDQRHCECADEPPTVSDAGRP